MFLHKHGLVKKLVVPVAIFFVFSFSPTAHVSAYDEQTTHPALTDEIVDFYNLSFSDKLLTAQQKEWVVDGSILEDTPPRWVNHFFDPVRQTGWTGANAGDIPEDTVRLLAKIGLTSEQILSAAQWIGDSITQQRYGNYGGDRTWKRGLHDYAHGDEENAYKTLGYALHLLEDMSVPEHTRDDTHAEPVRAFTGDPGSPYEQYATKYTRATLDGLAAQIKKEGGSPVSKSSIEEYLSSLAGYSNNYFFSKDTINNLKYALPKIAREDEKFIYGKDENFKEFPLAKMWFIKKNLEIIKTYVIEKNDEYILDAYFSRLSRQVVLHGAGLINLWKVRVEDALINKEFEPEPAIRGSGLSKILDFFVSDISPYGEWNRFMNFAGKIYNTAKNFLSSAASALGKTFQDILGADGEEPALVIEIGKEQMANGDTQDNADGAGFKNPAQEQPQIVSPETNPPVKNRDAPKTPPDEQNNEPENLTDLPPAEPQMESSDGETPAPEQNPDLQPEAPAAAAQPNFCSFNYRPSPLQNVLINEIAWMGTAEGTSNEWLELKNRTGAAINLSGWRLLNQDGKIEVIFGQNDKIAANGFFLLERTDDKSLPNIKADKIYTGALGNDGEWLRLFNNKCELADEIDARPASGKSAGWSKFGGNNATKQTLERNPDSLNWQTSLTAGGTLKAQNTRPAGWSGGVSGSTVLTTGGSSQTSNSQVVNNPAGNSTTTSSGQQANPAKLLVTEVQITGDTGKTGDDFVEIYNPNDLSVNLNGYRLVKRTKTGTTDYSIKSWTSDTLIPAKSFYVWANSGYTTLSPAPDTTTSATLAADNGIAIRFGAADTGTIIDAVGWGGAQNAFVETAAFPSNPGANQGLHRKYQNGNFSDTDNNQNDFELRNCVSPKSATSSCGAVSAGGGENQAPGAFFVYTPAAPRANEEIFFSAASSSDPDGQIVLYKWNFGDGNTASSSATSTVYRYAMSGDYQFTLTVQDDSGATSTATTTIAVSPDERSGPDHLVIGEIYPDRSGDNFDFVEIYNPTAASVSLDGYQIRIRRDQATSTHSLASFSAEHTIAPKSFFLLGLDNYENGTGTVADLVHSSYFLPTSDPATIYLVQNESIIDEAAYNPAELGSGESLERRAFKEGVCVSAAPGAAGEFSGNGCDTDSASDFAIRSAPQPQSSQNLPEPRNQPLISNFSAQYTMAGPQIDFSWEESEDANGDTLSGDNAYVLRDISDPGSPSQVYAGDETSAQMTPQEVGRNYDFEFRVTDRDGLGNTATTTLAAESFMDNVHFYKDTRSGAQNNRYILDMIATSSRPFWDPNDSGDGQNYKAVIAYFNRDAPTQWQISTRDNLTPDDNNVAAPEVPACHGGDETPGSVLVFAYNQSSCRNGGSLSGAMPPPESSRLAVKVYAPRADLAATDFITLAFYDFGGGDGGDYVFNLAAVDKTRYYFKSPRPPQEAPSMPENFSAAFDDFHSKLNLGWSASTDADSPDHKITYETNYATSTSLTGAETAELSENNWQSAGTNTGAITNVIYPYYYKIAVRAKDDFGNVSETASSTWSFPDNYSPLPMQADHGANLGRSTDNADYGQTILFNSTVTIDAIEAWTGLALYDNRWGSSNSKIRVFLYEDGHKNGLIAESQQVGVGANEAPGARLYVFNPAIAFDAGKTYLFAPANTQPTDDTTFYGSAANAYADGAWNNNPTQDIYFYLRRAAN